MLAYAPTPYVTIHHDLIMLPFGLKKGNIVVTLQIKGNIAKVIHMYNKMPKAQREAGTGLNLLGCARVKGATRSRNWPRIAG